MFSESILTKVNIATLRNGQKIEISTLAGSNMTANIKIEPKNGKYIAKVELYLDNPKEFTGLKTQKTVKDINALDITIATLIRCLTIDFDSQSKKTKAVRVKGTLRDFKERVYAVPDVFNPESYGLRKRTKKYYAKATVQGAVTYLAETIGSMYAICNTLNPTETQMYNFYNAEIERIMQQGDDAIKVREQVANSLAERWARANRVLRYCRTFEDLGPWPENDLPEFIRSKSYSIELIKVLPYERLIMVATFIVQACKAAIPEAFSVCGMIFCGMRVGESAALRMSRFEFNGKLGRYYIKEQVGKDGKITDILKNDYSYRYAYIYGVMRDMYNLRVQQLKERGYSDDEIKDAFFGSGEDIHSPIRKERASAFMKNLFVLAGCNKEEIKTIEAEIAGDAGFDCDHNFCAHLSRKLYATYASNGGVDNLTVDALLGHENTENKSIDYAGWDNAAKIIGMLSRCMYFGSLTDTINPAYSDVFMHNENAYILEGNHQYIFYAEEDGYISGAITTLESDADLIFTSDNDIVLHPNIEPITDDKKSKSDRVVLTNIPPSELIESWIKQAKLIWETKFGEMIQEEIDYE